MGILLRTPILNLQSTWYSTREEGRDTSYEAHNPIITQKTLVLSCCSDDGRIERKNDFHNFWLIVYPTYSINGNPFPIIFLNMVWEVTIYRGMLDFWRWKDVQLPRGLDWAFPALTAFQQLFHMIPCMLIDVCTTFRVDWYVFPLFTPVERVSRCCPWCCCNFCVFGARCHENNGLWAT